MIKAYTTFLFSADQIIENIFSLIPVGKLFDIIEFLPKKSDMYVETWQKKVESLLNEVKHTYNFFSLKWIKSYGLIW